MQITFIRHLPTEWNKKTWLQGRRDIDISPLTEELRREIQENQLLLKQRTPFDSVLASRLKRTHQTAELYGYHAETEGLLDELDFGPFEGRPKQELLQAFGERWVDRPREIILGESVVDLERRMVSFLCKYREKSNILVFGHGSWIRAILSYAQHSHINEMNKLLVRNNECITLNFDRIECYETEG